MAPVRDEEDHVIISLHHCIVMRHDHLIAAHDAADRSTHRQLDVLDALSDHPLTAVIAVDDRLQSLRRTTAQ